MRELYRTLDRGGVVGLLPDQDPGPGAGVFAPFFGVPANTTLLIARLLRRTGAAAFLTWAERLDEGRGYDVHVEELGDVGLASLDDARAAAALNEVIEAAVRRRPEQYLWSYRRFRRLPDGRRPYHERSVGATVGEPREVAVIGGGGALPHGPRRAGDEAGASAQPGRVPAPSTSLG